MRGFDRLKEQIKDIDKPGLKKTVDYLLTRTDMESKYLNEEKDVKEMDKYIKVKGKNHCKEDGDYIPDEVVYAWAVMYYSFPNSFLKINKSKGTKSNNTSTNANTNNANKTNTNNVIYMKDAKKKVDSNQISMFGGIEDEKQ